jgi:triosephosphate isomerase
MARKIVAGNWKMNLNLAEGAALVKAANDYLNANPVKHIDVIVAPPAHQLVQTVKLATNTKLSTVAQNMAAHENGAYTGEISASMLVDAGVELVIVGHSERREIFGEDDALLEQKLHKALEHGLYPIFCVGETLEQRKAGEHFKHIENQLQAGLSKFAADQLPQIIIAYEPIWAIGTGETASNEQAQEMHAFIRKHLATISNAAVADEVSILYGGSVKPANARGLFGQPDIDGGLIGGASIQIDSFLELIKIGEDILR